MGNGQSTDEYSTARIKEIMSEFRCLGERNDPQYGNIRIYQSKQQPSQRIYMSSKVFQNKQEHQQFISSVSKRKKINDPALSELIGFHNMVDENLCGNSFQLNLYGEWFENNLEKEVNLRNDEVDYFQEPDIIYIMATICRVMSLLENQEITHGDIRPNQLILTQQAQLKLTHHTLVHPMKSNYLKTLVVGDKAYLAPELMIALDQRQIDPQYDRNKADIYSLGMMMLYLMTFIDPSSSCYNYLNNTLDQNDVTNLVQLALKRYGQSLVGLVQKMLSIQPSARLNFTYYHNQIQQMYPVIKDSLSLKREAEENQSNTNQFDSVNTNNHQNMVDNVQQQNVVDNQNVVDDNQQQNSNSNYNSINTNVQNPSNGGMFSVHNKNNGFNIGNNRSTRQSGQYQQGINFQNRQFNINRNQEPSINNNANHLMQSPNHMMQSPNHIIQSPNHNFNNQEEEIIVNENKVETQSNQNYISRQISNQWQNKDTVNNTDEQQSQQSYQQPQQQQQPYQQLQSQQSYQQPQQQQPQQYQSMNQKQQPTTPISRKQSQFIVSPQSNPVQYQQKQPPKPIQQNNIFNQPTQPNRLENFQQKVQIQQQFQSPNRTLDDRDTFKSPQRILQSPQNNFITSPNYSQNANYQRPPINNQVNNSGFNQTRNSGFSQTHNQPFNSSMYQQPQQQQYSVNSNASSIYQSNNPTFQQPNSSQIYRKIPTHEQQSNISTNQPQFSNNSSIVSQQNYQSRYVYNQPQSYQPPIRPVVNNTSQLNSNSYQFASPNRSYQNPIRQNNPNYPPVQLSNMPGSYQTDLDRRVQMAIQNSQNAIAKNYTYQ